MITARAKGRYACVCNVMNGKVVTVDAVLVVCGWYVCMSTKMDDKSRVSAYLPSKAALQVSIQLSSVQFCWDCLRSYWPLAEEVHLSTEYTDGKCFLGQTEDIDCYPIPGGNSKRLQSPVAVIACVQF